MPWFGGKKHEEEPPGNPGDKGAEGRLNSGKSEGKPEPPSKTDPEAFPCLKYGISPVGITCARGPLETGFDFPDHAEHPVRGPKYLVDKVKIPSQPFAFNLVEVAGFQTHPGETCRFSADLEDSYYQRARKAGRNVFVFVMHFDLNPMHVVMVFELNENSLEKDLPFKTCFQRFLEGDDAYKNKRIKLLTSAVEANWIVKKAIGKPVPALIGNKLTCHYKQTADLCECSCDVNSSMAASAIVGVSVE